MDRDEYFEISKQKELPIRCPIVNYCSRRAETIYIFSEYQKYVAKSGDLDCYDTLIRVGVLSKDFRKYQVQVQGEAPSIFRGSDHFAFFDCCPEVNLFESSHSMINDIASTAGSYDKDRKSNQKQISKCQHYSECPEFSYYLFHKKNGNGKKRKSIPLKTKALLQKEINSSCPFCSNDDVGHFQVHHIDENPENNEMENLLMVCPTCHSKITKLDISFEEVRLLKQSLIK
jgi:hypothetical protein